MIYELTLDGGDEAIQLTPVNKKHIITDVQFLISQEEVRSNDKSDALFNTIQITGDIFQETKETTKKLFEWSLKVDDANIYKTLTLVIREKEGGQPLREIVLKNIYCVSYEERYGTSTAKDEYGNFVICLRQKKGYIDTIKVSC